MFYMKRCLLFGKQLENITAKISVVTYMFCMKR